jgi:outer membrane protein OmpA-like peptidoglycan-associated protein
LAIELGAFGQFTKFDSELKIDNGLQVGGRAALFLLKNLSAEGDILIGSVQGETRDFTYRPMGARIVYGVPLSERLRLLLGLGYQLNVYEGRTRPVGTIVEKNEYEDAFTGLVGLKYCLNDRWSLRFDGVVDHNPSPNEQPEQGLTGTSTNMGIRAGLGFLVRGECAGAPFDWTLAVAPPSSSNLPGETVQLQTNAQDNRARPIAATQIRNLTWVSSNPAAATVDATGRVTTVAPGSATITATGIVRGVSRSATSSITVRPLRWTLSVAPASASADTGQTVQLSASAVNERGATVTGAITWTSSAPNIATVSNTGLVRCVRGGTATITASMTAEGSTNTATSTITCREPPPPPRAALLVRLVGDVHFAFNSANLSRAGRDTLNWLIRQMGTAENANMIISIEGHTDPYGSDEYNERLAERRTNAVVTYLTRTPGGVDAGRVRSASFGERCLVLADDHDRPQRSRAEHVENRRVEIWDLRGTQVPSACRPASDYQNR